MKPQHQPPTTAFSQPINYLALTATCRQLHTETPLLPFSQNTFTVAVANGDLLRLYNYLALDQAAAIDTLIYEKGDQGKMSRKIVATSKKLRDAIERRGGRG
jgi:hypothetical protein